MMLLQGNGDMGVVQGDGGFVAFTAAPIATRGAIQFLSGSFTRCGPNAFSTAH